MPRVCSYFRGVVRFRPALALWPRNFGRSKAVGLATFGLSRAMRFARQPERRANVQLLPKGGQLVRAGVMLWEYKLSAYRCWLAGFPVYSRDPMGVNPEGRNNRVCVELANPFLQPSATATCPTY